MTDNKKSYLMAIVVVGVITFALNMYFFAVASKLSIMKNNLAELESRLQQLEKGTHIVLVPDSKKEMQIRPIPIKNKTHVIFEPDPNHDLKIEPVPGESNE